MNTESQSTVEEQEQPNLMVLKGIVFGLGVLLLLGMVLIAVKISSGMSDGIGPVAAPTLDDVPSIPLRYGEQIVSVSAGEGQIFILLEDELSQQMPRPRRILAISSAGGATEWSVLHPAAEPDTAQ